jgi:hypothetical protein
MVFGVTVFVVYSWSIRGFLYALPSFLLHFSLGGIFSILSYMMAFALIESLLVTSGLVITGFILPSKWLKEGFAFKGFLIVAVATVAMIELQGFLSNSFPSANHLLRSGIIYVFVLIGLFLLFQNIRWLQSALLFVEEQISVFIFLYVPVGIIGLVVVLLRNFL